MDELFSRFLKPFDEYPKLRSRVRTVLEQLPKDVIDDFLQEEGFHVSLENFVPGQGSSVWMAMPKEIGTVSRAVILRKRLNDCDEAFALYIIAHEFAHARLHNGSWGEITDPELAADALAATWGFPKVARPRFFQPSRWF